MNEINIQTLNGKIKEHTNSINNVRNIIEKINIENMDLNDKIKDYEIQCSNFKNDNYTLNNVVIKERDLRCEKERQNQRLNYTTSSINNQLEAINQIKASCSESLNNFVERDDENGYHEYQKKILSLKDVKKFSYLNNNNNIFSKTFLKFYETDYIDIDVDENNETIGEKKFNIEGLNQELHLKLNGETDEEIIINLLINLNAFGDENERNESQKYHGYLLINNNCNVIGIFLNEKMIHENVLILGRTIIKNGLKTIVNEENKIHAKLILSHFNF
jgi:hypothetical protein